MNDWVSERMTRPLTHSLTHSLQNFSLANFLSVRLRRPQCSVHHCCGTGSSGGWEVLAISESSVCVCVSLECELYVQVARSRVVE